MTQNQNPEQHTYEIKLEVHGETVTGTLTTAAGGNSLHHLFDLLRASRHVDELLVRDAGSVVWSVVGDED